MRHAQLLQAALAVAHGQALPERVGPAQQYVVDHAQRVGPGPERAAHRRAVRQRQAVGLGGDQRRRPGHERRERHAGAAPGPAEPAQLADRRVEADVGLAPAVVPLERLLRRERAGPQYVPADRKHRTRQSRCPSAFDASVHPLMGARHPRGTYGKKPGFFIFLLNIDRKRAFAIARRWTPTRKMEPRAGPIVENQSAPL